MYLQNKQKEEKKTKIEILSKSSNPVLKGIGFLGRGIKKIKGLGQ